MAPAIGLGLGVSFCHRPRPSGPDMDTLALIARMAVPPDQARAKLIDTLVLDLKSSGVWQTLDGLYVLAAHDAQAARLNWRGNLLNLTPGAAPVFTVDRGYKGDGAAAYLAIDGSGSDVAKFTLESASVGIWVNQVAVEAGIALGRTSDYGMQIVPLSASETLRIQFQSVSSSQATTVITGHNGLGMSRGTREDSARYFVRSQGRARIVKNIPAQPGGPVRWPQRLLSGTSSTATLFSTARIAVAYFGGGLTSAQEVAMDAALQTYLNAVGGA